MSGGERERQAEAGIGPRIRGGLQQGSRAPKAPFPTAKSTTGQLLSLSSRICEGPAPGCKPLDMCAARRFSGERIHSSHQKDLESAPPKRALFEESSQLAPPLAGGPRSKGTTPCFAGFCPRDHFTLREGLHLPWPDRGSLEASLPQQRW